jgi:alpha-1,2-mannosyltransferase
MRRKVKIEHIILNIDIYAALIFFKCLLCASDSGGGGERVLWMLIAALLNSKPLEKRVKIVIYSGDTLKSRDEILRNVMTKFRIQIPQEQQEQIVFCKIYSRKYLDGSLYPFLTMLFQSLASVMVNVECLMRLTPDVYIDTTGVPYAYPLAKHVAGCQVMAYVHYPIISKDMLDKVRLQRPSFNNDSRISGSVTVSSVKLWYYQVMSALFSMTGHSVDMAFVNSSWTEGHMRHMWNSSVTARRQLLRNKEASQGQHSQLLLKVFPPCNTSHLQTYPLHMAGHDLTKGLSSAAADLVHMRKRMILSVGQFRPEKDHSLQLWALAALLKKDREKYADVRLVLLGSSRNEGDEAIIRDLKTLARTLEVEENVDFVVNAPFDK